MSTWQELYGFEPTTDEATIRRWADEGAGFAVALNDLPLDGPLHPAVLYGDPTGPCVVVCEGTGRRATTGPGSGPEAAEIAKGWGCTYMVLMIKDEEVTDA
jgi:hypothetical protein